VNIVHHLLYHSPHAFFFVVLIHVYLIGVQGVEDFGGVTGDSDSVSPIRRLSSCRDQEQEEQLELAVDASIPQQQTEHQQQQQQQQTAHQQQQQQQQQTERQQQQQQQTERQQQQQTERQQQQQQQTERQQQQQTERQQQQQQQTERQRQIEQMDPTEASRQQQLTVTDIVPQQQRETTDVLAPPVNLPSAQGAPPSVPEAGAAKRFSRFVVTSVVLEADLARAKARQVPCQFA
jgi:hypothetical protein